MIHFQSVKSSVGFPCARSLTTWIQRCPSPQAENFLKHVQDLEAQVQSMLEERDCSFMDCARLQRVPHC